MLACYGQMNLGIKFLLSHVQYLYWGPELKEVTL